MKYFHHTLVTPFLTLSLALHTLGTVPLPLLPLCLPFLRVSPSFSVLPHPDGAGKPMDGSPPCPVPLDMFHILLGG